jgi:predicted nucleic acid-binding protein
MKIYCEHGAVTADLRALQRDGRIELVHFPYDPESRARAIAPSATPSDAQWRDLNTTWNELTGTWDDFKGSPHLPEIRRIIGAANRRDALHVDSAFKTGCAAIVTVDRDILDHKDELETLLGLRIFHPDNDKDELRCFIVDRCGAG